jgi:hypothetical protein
MSEVPDNTDKDTGEVFDKPYQMPKHINYGTEIMKQLKYVRGTLKDPEDPDRFARLSGDTLSMVLMELTAMYESLSKWLADEKLHVADLKTEMDFKFADQYIMYKNRKSETNETARMQAKMACVEDERHLNKTKHTYDKVTAWKKSIGRYHDAVRSQLSYEKSMGTMSRGN